MELAKKKEDTGEKVKALQRALIGVNNKRMEAFLLLNATPEEYLTQIIDYLWSLNGRTTANRGIRGRNKFQ